jgi:FtsP/CotA-like multicopper oxidase with cupredoxin domain
LGVAAAVVLGSQLDEIAGVFRQAEPVPATQAALSLEEVLVEMVDLTPVYMWAFADPVNGPQIPGPAVLAQEETTVDITITNNLDEDHAFSIPGVVTSGILSPGQSERLTFQAPPAGTYMYRDPLNDPVNRVMGLHGVMVVMPKGGSTPYGDPTPQVQQLFNDLGTSTQFPGDAWDPARTIMWVFNEIDPALNSLLQNNQPVDPATFVRDFLPRYFTINGKSGFFSAHDPNISPHGRVGQPMLLRVLNPGLATHSPHIHGNHVYVLAADGRVQDNVFLVDTWTMRPDGRADVLLPFIRPPDIPPAAWPPVEEPFPHKFPMHCHTEMSQTSGGGNYPQGLVTDWVIEGTLL